MKTAGTLAGLKVLRVINEPTAACISCSLDKNNQAERPLVCIDVGASGMRSAAMLIEDGIYEICATTEDSECGGSAMTAALVAEMTTRFQQQCRTLTLPLPPLVAHRLWISCEQAKLALTREEESTVTLQLGENDVALSASITRADFNKLIEGCVVKMRDSLDRLMRDWRRTTASLYAVVVLGGACCVPLIHAMLRDYFHRSLTSTSSPFMLSPAANVALGAAWQGWLLTGVPQHCHWIGPLAVILLSIGVELESGHMLPVIQRNTTVPHRRVIRFSTLSANQQSVCVRVFAGERVLTRNNRLLGVLNVTRIAPAPKGVPVIQVQFDIDANERLTVSATDLLRPHDAQSFSLAADAYALKAEEHLAEVSRAVADPTTPEAALHAHELVCVELEVLKIRVERILRSSAVSEEQRGLLLATITDEHEWLEANGRARLLSTRDYQERRTQLVMRVENIIQSIT